MLIFLTATFCAVAVLFSTFPASLDIANRIHIENGRKPNAGIAFMPELIVVVALWWGAGLLLNYFFDRTIALLVIVSISTLMFVWQILLARRSRRDYLQFLAAHSLESEASETKQQQAEQGGDGDAEEAV